jgi:hypothetical protein
MLNIHPVGTLPYIIILLRPDAHIHIHPTGTVP